MSGVYTTDNSWMEEVDFSDEEQRCKALDAVSYTHLTQPTILRV